MSNRNSWHGGKSTSCATWKMSSPERYRDAWTSICLACRPWCALMRRELSCELMDTKVSRLTPGCDAFRTSMSGYRAHGSDSKCARMDSYSAKRMSRSGPARTPRAPRLTTTEFRN